jgi:hypothetical protein
MEHKANYEVEVGASLSAGGGMKAGITRKTHYKIECVRDGKVIWEEEFDNLVVNVGLNDSLDKHFKGSSYTAAWYVGLTDGTPTFDPADTMASHAGWTEVQTYDEAARQTLTLGAVSSQSVDNSANKASFTISGPVTVGGAFIVTDSSKGGTSGILYGGGAFSQDRSLQDTDVLNVTITLTAAAS